MTSRVFFIRHGETVWNVERRLQGHRDTPLTAKGMDQAAAAGRDLRDFLSARDGPDPFWVASSSGRACATMEAVRGAMGLAPERYTRDERLREMSFGRWEGLTWGEIKARDPCVVRARGQARWTFLPPDGESYAMLAQRLEPWTASLNGDVVAVAHAGVARALMVLIGGLSTAAAPEAEVPQGRILVFADAACRWV